MGFKTFIGEMTMKVKSYEQLEAYLVHFEHLLEDGEHCGDIEEFNIYKKSRGSLTDYAAVLDKKVCAFFVLKDNELKDAFVLKDFRKKGLFSAFLFFLKRNEGLSKIVLGDRQSQDTIEAVKRICKRFKTFWVKGSEKVPFDPNIEEPYYSHTAPTGWKIILENDGDFSSWQKFYHRDLQQNTRLSEMFYFSTFVDDLE